MANGRYKGKYSGSQIDDTIAKVLKGIQPGEITSEMLDDLSITSEKIANSSVTTDKISDKAIGLEKLSEDLQSKVGADFVISLISGYGIKDSIDITDDDSSLDTIYGNSENDFGMHIVYYYDNVYSDSYPVDYSLLMVGSTNKDGSAVINQILIKSDGQILFRKMVDPSSVAREWGEWREIYFTQEESELLKNEMEGKINQKPGTVGKYGGALFTGTEDEDTALAVGSITPIAYDLSGNMGGWGVDGMCIGVAPEDAERFEALEYVYVTYSGKPMKLKTEDFAGGDTLAKDVWGEGCFGADLFVYWYNDVDFNFVEAGYAAQHNLEPIGYIDNVFEIKKDGEIISDHLDKNDIVCGAEGTHITMTDSAERKLKGLNIYGKTTQAAVPTPEYPQTLDSLASDGALNVDVIGKNLFDVEKFVELVKTYDTTAEEMVVDGRNCIKFDIFRLYKKDFSEVVTFNPNNTYTWSMDIKFHEKYSSTSTSDCYLGMGFLYNDELGVQTNIGNTISGVPLVNRRLNNSMYGFAEFGKVSITSASGVPFNGIAFVYNDRGYWLIDLDSIQLEEGSVVTYYEPYTIQSLTLSTPNGLPGVPVSSEGNYTDSSGQQWVCDEIDLARGVYIQRCVEYIFNSSDVDMLHSGNGVWQYCTIPASALPCTLKDSAYGLWEMGSYYLYSGMDSFAVDTFYYVDFESISETSNGVVDLFFNLDYNRPLSDYDGSKLLLVRETPVEIPLSEAEIEAYKSLQTHKPVTHIFNDEGAHMAVKYIADTKNYIDNKIAELQTALLNATT